MKIRVISLFTVFIIAIMIVGCGGKPESMPSKSDSSQATSVKQKSGGSGSGDYLDPKTALTAFVNDYIEMKKPLWDLIAEQDSDGKYAMDLLPVPSADLMIAVLPAYDLLNGKGKLMTSGFDGFKEIDGGVIKFGCEYVWEEEQLGLHEKGDKIIESGRFDIGKKQLVKEEFIERGGKKISRSIYELMRLPDGGYVAQSFYMSEGKEASGVFISMNNKEIEVIIATGDKNVNLQYKSIIGASNVSPTDMAQGYKTVMIVKTTGGKVTFEKP